MLIHHSREIIVYRMARLEAESLGASQALIAKVREDAALRETRERLDAVEQPKGVEFRVDRRV